MAGDSSCRQWAIGRWPAFRAYVLVPIGVASALLVGCRYPAMTFSDHESSIINDGGDADSPETEGSETCDGNGCGGCAALPNRPGDACSSSCGPGTYVCKTRELVECKPNTAANECGGCAALTGRVGDSCGGGCKDGKLACDGTDAMKCVGSTESGMLCGGACKLTSSDPSHCGVCASACEEREYCLTGKCTCRAGLKLCGTICVDIKSDGDNCGGCSNGCGRLCSGGVCQDSTVTTCPVGSSKCPSSSGSGFSCPALDRDPLNCGGCGIACAADQVCVASACKSYKPAIGGCMACPCTSCGAGSACCPGLKGQSQPICVTGSSCPT